MGTYPTTTVSPSPAINQFRTVIKSDTHMPVIKMTHTPVIKMTQTPVTKINTHKKIAILKSPWPIYVGKSKISWYCPFRSPTLGCNSNISWYCSFRLSTLAVHIHPPPLWRHFLIHISLSLTSDTYTPPHYRKNVHLYTEIDIDINNFAAV